MSNSCLLQQTVKPFNTKTHREGSEEQKSGMVSSMLWYIKGKNHVTFSAAMLCELEPGHTALPAVDHYTPALYGGPPPA